MTNTSPHLTFTQVGSPHSGNSATDIYWLGARAALLSVRITTISKYNKCLSQAWFMSSGQDGRKENRQEEIVRRAWPHQNQKDSFHREERSPCIKIDTCKQRDIPVLHRGVFTHTVKLSVQPKKVSDYNKHWNVWKLLKLKIKVHAQ